MTTYELLIVPTYSGLPESLERLRKRGIIAAHSRGVFPVHVIMGQRFHRVTNLSRPLPADILGLIRGRLTDDALWLE